VDNPGQLNRMKVIRRADTLYGNYPGTFGNFGHFGDAGAHQFVVYDHITATALCLPASDLGPCQSYL
jgi:hypothetical protein